MELHEVLLAKTLTPKQGGGGGGVSKAYVDERDRNVLAEAKTYADEKVTTATITSEAGRLVCDMTASQIIDADRKGFVKAIYTDGVSGETRTYYFSKQMPGGRAVFSKDGYIENDSPKQALLYVDFEGKVEYETRGTINLKELALEVENKADRSIYLLGNSTVTQEDARDVLTYADQYTGLIEFVSTSESKVAAVGYILSNLDGTCLVTVSPNGTVTQWTKDGFAKHNIEAQNLINEPIVDLDNLTVDVAGNPPVLYMVRAAKNKPENTSTDGSMMVIPHAINKQLFIYTDMDSGKMWTKVVTGTDGQHSFGKWEALGGSVALEQTTGQATDKVMSQKAVTDELDKKKDTDVLVTVRAPEDPYDLTAWAPDKTYSELLEAIRDGKSLAVQVEAGPDWKQFFLNSYIKTNDYIMFYGLSVEQSEGAGGLILMIDMVVFPSSIEGAFISYAPLHGDYVAIDPPYSLFPVKSNIQAVIDALAEKVAELEERIPPAPTV